MEGTLFIIDVDGCIADARSRYNKAGKEPTRDKKDPAYKKWVKSVMDTDLIEKDPPVPGMEDLIYALHLGGQEVAFVTSREEVHRELTEKWMQDNGFMVFVAKVIMRPKDNLLPDHELKEQAIKKLVIDCGAANVVVIDDDLSGGLYKVCKKNGWTFLKIKGFSL